MITKLCSNGQVFSVKSKYTKHYNEVMLILTNKYPLFEIEIITPSNENEFCGGRVLRCQGSEWFKLELPQAIDNNTKLFLLAHEVAHIVLGHLDFENSDQVTEDEAEADDWASKMFQKWGLRRNIFILAAIECTEKSRRAGRV